MIIKTQYTQICGMELGQHIERNLWNYLHFHLKKLEEPEQIKSKYIEKYLIQDIKINI